MFVTHFCVSLDLAGWVGWVWGGAEDRVSVTSTGNWQTSDEQEVAICFYHSAPSYYLPLDCPGGRAENVSKRFWWNKERYVGDRDFLNASFATALTKRKGGGGWVSVSKEDGGGGRHQTSKKPTSVFPNTQSCGSLVEAAVAQERGNPDPERFREESKI